MIRGEMLIDMSSWNRSLQAYGISICEIYKTHTDEGNHKHNNAHLLYPCLVLAAPTLKSVGLEVGDGYETTYVTHVNTVGV